MASVDACGGPIILLLTLVDEFDLAMKQFMFHGDEVWIRFNQLSKISTRHFKSPSLLKTTVAQPLQL